MIGYEFEIDRRDPGRRDLTWVVRRSRFSSANQPHRSFVEAGLARTRFRAGVAVAGAICRDVRYRLRSR